MPVMAKKSFDGLAGLRILTAMRDGLPLGEALEAGFRHSRKPDERRPALVRAWFGHWAELGWICAPELDGLRDD